jgi:hypothetical protein
MGMEFHPVETRRAIFRRPKERDDAASLLFPIDGGGVNDRVPYTAPQGRTAASVIRQVSSQ